MEDTRQERRRKARQSNNPPPKENISVQEATRRLFNITAVIMCNLCEKKDTCVNRGLCLQYSDTPPNCPACNEVMDRKADGIFFCTACMLKDAKEKRMEELK